MSTSGPSWTQPASEAPNSKYPHNNVTQTESGHLFEMDDTPGAERINMMHRSGTFYEMHSNGDQVVKIKGTGYEIIVNDKNVLISGDCNITVVGNCNMHVQGDYNLQVDGDYTQKISGNIVQLNDSETSVDSRTTVGDLNLNASGDIYINAGGKVILNSDVTVTGDVGVNQSIKALGNITATMNVYGLAGLRTPGSLLVGPLALGPLLPAPIVNITSASIAIIGPTAINGATAITGATSINGATAITGIFSATGLSTLTGGAIIGGILYNTHTHVDPQGGVVGPPISPPAPAP